MTFSVFTTVVALKEKKTLKLMVKFDHLVSFTTYCLNNIALKKKGGGGFRLPLPSPTPLV